jgi:cupin superfamily acireductone dioxygenase involved in methionine salvage
MKYNTTLIQDGKTMDVIVEANSQKEAKIITKQNYKNSRVIGVSQITEER